MVNLNFIAILLVVMILFIIAVALIIYSLTAQRRRREVQQEHARQMGFAQTETSDPLLVDRVQRLFVRGPVSSVRLENVSQRLLSGGQAYLFDLYHQSTAKGGSHQGQMLGVISSDLRLPYFVLAPIPGRAGESGVKIMHSFERVLSAAWAAMGLTLVEFPDTPDFDSRFMVFGQTGREEEVRAFFESGRGSRLAGLDRDYLIQGLGDFFTMQNNPSTASSRDANPEQELNFLLADAQRVLGWMR